MRKTKLDMVLENTSGKFFTLGYKNKSSEGTFCAKLVGVSPKFVTVFDVNSETPRKLKRTSITRVSCGDVVYSR